MTFIAEAPGGLSERAARFLRDYSSRIDFDRGAVGADLSRRIQEIYGAPNEAIVEQTEIGVLRSRFPALVAALGSELDRVPATDGAHTHWFAGESTLVHASGLWAALTTHLDPLVRIWADTDGRMQEIRRVVEEAISPNVS